MRFDKGFNYNTKEVLQALKDKRINHLKPSYLKLISELTNNQNSSLKKKIKKTTPKEYSELLISYFEKYNISYAAAPDRKRKKENKDSVSNRQKAYIERQNQSNKKKIQVYLSEWDYDLLQTFKEHTNKTYSEIIGTSLRTQYLRYPSWSR